MIITVLSLYFVLVLTVGWLSHRLFRGTGEDYFLATRTIGPFVLLMSLFGTHMTAFALLGASGESYRKGVGVFALMASSSAVVVPVLFFFMGTRMWWVGKRNGLMTQAQFFRERYESDLLGTVLFVVLLGLLIPYLLLGVMGGGITLNLITGGSVPEWVGSLTVCLVVLAYVTAGGLRGTAWANTFQTLVFMGLGAVTFWVIVSRLGGLSIALERVSATTPELLRVGGNINPLTLVSYTLIPLSAGMFPHIFMHWLTARRAESFRSTVIFYPLCVAVVWVPTVLLGVIGHPDFPGLQPAASSSILVRLITLHAPDLLAGLLGVGVLAAVMSSLDSQVLAIGTMFTQDIVRHHGLHDQMTERQQVFVGRLFVVAVLACSFALSRVVDRSIFSIGVWSFTGFASLVPVALAALFWRRSTRHGVLASVCTVVLLGLYFFVDGWKTPDYTVGGTGIMPVAVILPAAAAVLVIVSLVTSMPSQKVLSRFFPPSRSDQE